MTYVLKEKQFFEILHVYTYMYMHAILYYRQLRKSGVRYKCNIYTYMHLCGIPLGQKKNKYYFDFPNSGSISDLSLKSQVEM